ncbi:acyl-CoA synthetase [Hippea alviniae]|uniref:acyl-CoA synthetase n=1 Tax=Hippea alviniae TaxID=1279027 RepID=UPI0003B45156|nr:AMP-binding protein [Hippea alviniae]
MKHNMVNYEEEVRNFKLEVPEYYNFAFDVVDKWAEDRTKLALVWADTTGKTIKKYTFWDISMMSNKFANVLLSLGIKKGDHVFIMVPRIVEWYAVMLGLNKVGAVAMPAPNILMPDDIRYRIRQGEAVMAIASASNASKVEQACSNGDCPSLKVKMIIDGDLEGWVSFENQMDKATDKLSKDDVEPTKATDPLLIYFTSGTTKYPKMVMHEQSYALAHIVTAKYWHDLQPTDLHWTISDTGWGKAVWGKLYGQWQIGAAVFMHNAGAHFDPKITLRLLTTQGITSFCAPPTVYRMLIQEDLSKYDFSSLRHCTSAGEPINPEVIKAWKNATGTLIYDGYGQTESVLLVANYPCMPIKYGSMGKPVPGFDVKIVDDDGNEMPVGEPGHIAVRIKPEHPIGLTKGYYKDEAATAEAFRGDFYFTGDRAYQDVDGYFWFYGRADDVIKSSGYRIGPFEVESALQEHPAVVESAVVGSPDPIRGTIVKAFIILADGYEPGEELIRDIQDFVKKKTAPYKYPREIEFVKELPKTISGKIKRAVLRRMEIERKLGKKGSNGSIV